MMEKSSQNQSDHSKSDLYGSSRKHKVATLKPPHLEQGDTIGIMAPASPVKPEILERGVRTLEKLGFRVRIHPQTFFRTKYYTAGTDSERAAAFNDLVSNPGLRAIILARGGYGSIRLLHLVDTEKLKTSPRIVIGCSDATSLLLHLRKTTDLVVFHGPMASGDIASGKADMESMLNLLMDTGIPGTNLRFSTSRILHPGSAEGRLEGGCLSLVAASAGTPHEIKTDGAVLFLEDTGVKPYQIDRMLTSMRLAGLLDGVRGIVFGDMPGCTQHPDQGYTLEELLTGLTADLNIPVFYGLPSGHTAPGKKSLTLPIGIRVVMEPDGTIRPTEEAVS